MADDLDSIVKGAPIPTAEAAASEANAHAHASPGSHSHAHAGASPFSGAGKPGDPLHHTPSSPSMIYLNLLILEASMRAQFLELRARKRHHTFFLAILTLWVAFFGYKLYFAPREDGRGVGGSIYWAVEGAQKVCFMGGIITAALVWATGIWDRGIRWPRRWFAISNRGLRGFNCKLVVVRQTWWAEALSTVAFFLTYGLFSHTASSSYRLVEPQLLRQVEKELQLTSDNHPTLVLPPDDDELGGHEEDLAPGGDYVKLLLLPKPFSPTFRENWELYRTEYWERENERRRLLRQKVKEHDRKVAKDQHGWLWWLPWHQNPQPRIRREPQKLPHHRLASAERKRRNSSVRRSSVSSSRSQTPLVFDSDGQTTPRKQAPAADKRRKPAGSISKVKRPGTDSRSVTPDIPSRLSRESSVTLDAETDGGSGRTLRSTSKRASPAPLSAD